MKGIRLGQDMRVKSPATSTPFKGWMGKVQEISIKLNDPDEGEPYVPQHSIQLAFEPDTANMGGSQLNPSFVWFLAEELEVV